MLLEPAQSPSEGRSDSRSQAGALCAELGEELVPARLLARKPARPPPRPQPPRVTRHRFSHGPNSRGFRGCFESVSIGLPVNIGAGGTTCRPNRSAQLKSSEIPDQTPLARDFGRFLSTTRSTSEPLASD